ncbi:hypothetical protein AB0M20_45105, partial [Actinoplanes sp. NPDC051633]|uniref:hypothetical protein n=1 Tax=Actinoplanes sp. NPDC051633 TaxID=3155670 RepID=UPI0034259802
MTRLLLRLLRRVRVLLLAGDERLGLRGLLRRIGLAGSLLSRHRRRGDRRRVPVPGPQPVRLLVPYEVL